MGSNKGTARSPTGERELGGRRSARRSGASSHPAATSIDFREASVADELLRLDQLDPNTLRLRWQARMGNAARAHLPRSVKVCVLAYRLQADAFGDLDAELVRQLGRIAEERAGAKRGIDTSRPSGHTLSLDAIGMSDKRAGRLQPGCVLVREHGGAMHHVMVLAEGFAWNGQTFSSLSKVALAITGTSWNGPRFFGLDRKPSNLKPDPRTHQKLNGGAGRMAS